MMRFKVGDYVKGSKGSSARYLITNEHMTKGVVTAVGITYISIKILEYNGDYAELHIGNSYNVEPRYFEPYISPNALNKDLIVLLDRNDSGDLP